MDSLTQIALGSAVSLAAMGRRTAAWKAVLWGAVAGTLPDLDALIDHGDPVSNMVLHRGWSHALLYLTFAAVPLGWAVARLHGESGQWKRWCWALWLALFTHPLLDWMTVYGTQLLRPFSREPYGLGSMFIIDPLYTVPLIVAIAPDRYAEGFYALADGGRPVRFTVHDRGVGLIQRFGALEPVRQVAHFSHGFFRMREENGHLFLTDLRMGQEPAYTFHFDLGTPAEAAAGRTRITQSWQRPDPAAALPALWRRIRGQGGGDGLFGTPAVAH